jgi:hypothetical protein
VRRASTLWSRSIQHSHRNFCANAFIGLSRTRNPDEIVHSAGKMPIQPGVPWRTQALTAPTHLNCSVDCTITGMLAVQGGACLQNQLVCVGCDYPSRGNGEGVPSPVLPPLFLGHEVLGDSRAARAQTIPTGSLFNRAYVN